LEIGDIAFHCIQPIFLLVAIVPYWHTLDVVPANLIQQMILSPEFSLIPHDSAMK
jgi:hypothetical protein